MKDFHPLKVIEIIYPKGVVYNKKTYYTLSKIQSELSGKSNN